MNVFRPFPLPTRRFPPRRLIPDVVHRRRRWLDFRALASILVLSIVACLALLAPLISPYDPLAVDPANQFTHPSARHLLGTDLFGRDVFSRVLYGSRISLVIGFLAVLIACVPGVILGLVAGYFRGRLGAVIMRFMDMLLAFPGILLSLSIVAMLGPGLLNVVLAVGIASIPNYTRVVRAQALVLRRSLYVRAAHSLGASRWRIISRHIFPNVLGSIIVLTTTDFAWVILNASSLSFLGLGVQPPTPDWGVIINEGRSYMYQAPWITIGPGLVFMVTILAINLLGDSLRDTNDPRLKM